MEKTEMMNQIVSCLFFIALFIITTNCTYHREYYRYPEKQAFQYKSDLPQGSYKELYPVTVSERGFIWADCEDLSKEVLQGLIFKANSLGGNAVTNVEWRNAGQWVVEPSCERNWWWFLVYFWPGLGWWVSHSEARAVAISFEDKPAIAQTETIAPSSVMPVTAVSAEDTIPASIQNSIKKKYLYDGDNINLYIQNFELKGFPEVPQTFGEILAAEAQSALAEFIKIKASTTSNLQDQLKKEEQKELLACNEQSCLQQIIENFGFSDSLFGRVSKIDGIGEKPAYQIYLTYAKNSEVIRSKSKLITNPFDISECTQSIRELTLELFATNL